MDERTTQALCGLVEIMTLQHRETMERLQSIADEIDKCFEMCEAHADSLINVSGDTAEIVAALGVQAPSKV